MTGSEEPLQESRDQQILRRLANIEHKLDSIEQTNTFALRADAQRHFESVKKIFGQSRRRAQVYLAADGQRSVQEIADFLGMKQPNVSKHLDVLGQEGLLEIFEREGGRSYWGKKSIDRTVRISPFVMEEFELNRDGLPLSD